MTKLAILGLFGVAICSSFQNWLQLPVKRSIDRTAPLKMTGKRKWTSEEDNQLLGLRVKPETVALVANRLNRTSLAVKQRFTNLFGTKNGYMSQDERELMKVVAPLAVNGTYSWRKIQQINFPNRSHSFVIKNGKAILNIVANVDEKVVAADIGGFGRGKRWSAEESNTLRLGVMKYGRKWTKIAAELLPHRSPEACFDHWRYSLKGCKVFLHYEPIDVTAEVEVTKGMPSISFQHMLQRIDDRAAQEFIHDQLVKATSSYVN